jgi:hypothetical protein
MAVAVAVAVAEEAELMVEDSCLVVAEVLVHQQLLHPLIA